MVSILAHRPFWVSARSLRSLLSAGRTLACSCGGDANRRLALSEHNPRHSIALHSHGLALYIDRAKAGLPKNLVLYCGRHDFGTRVLKKTGNLKPVMQTMGQKDVKTAMKYQHPELDIVRTALNETAPGSPQSGA